MQKSIFISIITTLLIGGCATKKPTVEEQIARQYDPNNKNIQVVQIKQSHGLAGDAIDGIFGIFK